MKYSDNTLLFSFTKKILIGDRNSIVIFLFLIFFYTLSLLFSHFISSYKEKFIDKLQSVYPLVYIHTLKKVEPINKNYTHSKEVFEVNYQNLQYSFDHNSTKNTFVNMGVRSFTKEHIPKALSSYKKHIDQKEMVIYLDHKKYMQIVLHKDYNGGIYLSSQETNKQYFVQIKSFQLFDTANWIVIPNYIAKDIFYKNSFDKVVIHQQGTNDYNTLKNDYQHFNNLYFWYDNLSFFSKTFYKVSQLTYSYFNQSFLLLILLFAYITLKNIIHEMKKMTLFASRFGKNLFTVTAIYFISITSYFLLIILISYLLATLLNNLSMKITELQYKLHFPIEHLSILVVFIFFVVSFFVFYYAKITKRVDYV